MDNAAPAISIRQRPPRPSSSNAPGPASTRPWACRNLRRRAGIRGLSGSGVVTRGRGWKLAAILLSRGSPVLHFLYTAPWTRRDRFLHVTPTGTIRARFPAHPEKSVAPASGMDRRFHAVHDRSQSRLRPGGAGDRRGATDHRGSHRGGAADCGTGDTRDLYRALRLHRTRRRMLPARSLLLSRP